MERLLLDGGPAREVAARCVVRLRRDAKVTSHPQRGVQVTGPFCVLTFGDIGEVLGAVQQRLAAGEFATDELGAELMGQGGVGALMRLQKMLQRLDREGLLEHSVLLNGEAFARLRPVGRGPTDLPRTVDEPVALSRFAVVRAEDERLVASAPGSHLVLELAPAAGALMGSLARRRTPADHAEAVGMPAPVFGDVLRHLAAAGVVCAGTADLATEERSQAQWSSPDRWLHAVSRGPRTVRGYGGTYRDAERFAPLPAVAPCTGTRTVALPVPDLATIAAFDPSLTTALDTRRSVREHDSGAPVTLGQLAELLYRVARQSPAFLGSDGQELTRRPYPSGGAVHELEIYPLVTDCVGLDAGLWHYRATEHQLELVGEPSGTTAALVAGARDGAVMAADPQITLLITARFGRVMWKYESVAYSLILKHVGVLYQTIYLVGTAMNLAVCGLGGGDAADFATASGLDPFTEGTVGEMVVGSLPAALSHPYRLDSLDGPGDQGAGQG